MDPENNDKDDALDQGGTGEQSAQSDAAVAGKDTDQGDVTGTTPEGQKPEGESGKESGKDEPPKSALDAVLKVVGDKRAEATKDADDAAKAAPAKKDDAAGGDDKDDLTGKVEKEEWDKLPQRTRQRITQFRAKLRAADETIQTITPKAKVYDDLVGYCKTHSLSQDDFSEGLEIMRLVKQDPAAAYERLKPILAQLQEHVGEVLPTDLKAELDEGKITEARAKELAHARKEQERLSQQGKRRDEAAQQREQTERAQRYVEDVTRSVKGWEAAWKGSDPDYKIKAPRVWERMQALLAAEKELTPKKAVEIAEKARKDVEDWMAQLAPAKKGKEPVPQGGSGPTKKKPTSALEAAQQALEQGRVAA